MLLLHERRLRHGEAPALCQAAMSRKRTDAGGRPAGIVLLSGNSPEGAAGMEAPDCACDGSQWPGGTVSGIGRPPGVPADSRSGPGELLGAFQPELLRPAGKS